MGYEPINPFPIQARAAVLEGKTSRRIRHKISTLIYVKLDQDNGGIIHDLSEFGVAVQTVAPLRIHQHVHVRFDLPGSRSRVDVIGHVAWVSNSGRAGIQFTQIGPRSRQILKEWLLGNLLATASYVSKASGMFAAPRLGGDGELVFSPAANRTEPSEERLESAASPQFQNATDHDLSDLLIEFWWWPVPIVATTFSSVVDALVLILSLMIFGSIFLAIGHQIPPWPTTLATAVGALFIFSSLYRLMFVSHGNGTPGFRLALIALPKPEQDSMAERESNRFR